MTLGQYRHGWILIPRPPCCWRKYIFGGFCIFIFITLFLLCLCCSLAHVPSPMVASQIGQSRRGSSLRVIMRFTQNRNHIVLTRARPRTHTHTHTHARTHARTHTYIHTHTPKAYMEGKDSIQTHIQGRRLIWCKSVTDTYA